MQVEGQFQFQYHVYNSIDELPDLDATLLQKAIEVTQNAYAPYSNFKVGAAARLSNGQVIAGVNQENASYPVGICAERNLLAAAETLHHQVPITAMAISYENVNGSSERPISPCGMCRQALLEHETRFKQPMKLILGGRIGKIYVIDAAQLLLPLSFTGDDLK